jgi:hypothetical protein
MKKILYAFVFVCSGLLANAQTTYLAEHFDYPAGDSLQNHGWYAHSAGTTSPILVHTSGLSWSQTPYIGSGVGNAAIVNNNGSDENMPLSSGIESGSAYISFLLKLDGPVTASNPNNRGYFLHTGEYSNIATPDFTSISFAFRARTFVTVGSTPDKFRLGLTFNSATIPSNVGVDVTNDLDTGVTYLVVLKYAFIDGADNDEIFMYVFEDGDDISMEPTTPTLGPIVGTAPDMAVMQYVALRQYNLNPNLVIDGIVVKDAWDLLPTPLTGPSLLSPANNTVLKVEGQGNSEVNITWTAIADAPESPIYFWQLTTQGNIDFEDPALQLLSNNTGADNVLTLTLGDIDGVLAGLGLEVGDTLKAAWRVAAIVGDDGVVSVDTFNINLVRGVIFGEIDDFNLLTPANGARVLITNVMTDVVDITWESTSAGSAPVSYTFKTDTVGGGTFSNPFIDVPSNNGGADNQLTFTFGQVNALLTSFGVPEGDSISFIWTVFASAGGITKEANMPFELKLVREKTVSVNKISANTLKVYPNPTTSLVNIDLPSNLSSNAKVSLTNVLGQEVVLNDITRNANSMQVNVNHLPNGVYTIKVIDGGSVSTGSLVIQK